MIDRSLKIAAVKQLVPEWPYVMWNVDMSKAYEIQRNGETKEHDAVNYRERIALDAAWKESFELHKTWTHYKLCVALVKAACILGEYAVDCKHEKSMISGYLEARKLLKECESEKELELRLMLKGMQNVVEKAKGYRELKQRLKTWFECEEADGIKICGHPLDRKLAVTLTEGFSASWLGWVDEASKKKKK